MTTESAIRDTLQSTNVADANLEPANVVDVIHQLARSTYLIANAISLNGGQCDPAKDDFGGCVSSVAEGLLSISHGASAIAEAIDNLAEAIRQKG